jgi:hypothetical protein
MGVCGDNATQYGESRVHDLISPKRGGGDRILQYSVNSISVHSSKVYVCMGKLGIGKFGR